MPLEPIILGIRKFKKLLSESNTLIKISIKRISSLRFKAKGIPKTVFIYQNPDSFDLEIFLIHQNFATLF